jgi:hypothetical protein
VALTASPLVVLKWTAEGALALPYGDVDMIFFILVLFPHKHSQTGYSYRIFKKLTKYLLLVSFSCYSISMNE